MRSDNVTKGAERAPNRSLFYALGYTPEELERPLIGVVSAYSEARVPLSPMSASICRTDRPQTLMSEKHSQWLSILTPW